MEELLNKLIEKGWKTFGYKGMKATVNIYGEIRFEREGHFFIETFRTLTSKESNLWQFVCENGMIKHEVYEDIQSWEHTTADHSDFWYTSGDNYEFYVIESALKDESELEGFLLDNIKIGK